MAIVAILTTIAVPAFQGSVRKSRRTEAITTLLDIQLRQEKWRANHSAYGSLADMGGIAANGYYEFSVEAATNTYEIKATAAAGTDQVSDHAQGTACSPLTLNQSGEKKPEACWK
jgi:type IV pilus assembly protein PilE